MDTVTGIGDLRHRVDDVRRRGATVGLVPTMGYLHDGHLSLVERSGRECDYTVSTIFVNPLQFAAGEDLSTYPRDPDGDSAKAAAAGSDLLFSPALDEMYPEPVRTNVAVDLAVGFMESEARPTHFDGVTTVVSKLFAMVGPCRAYFGEKDYQQLAVVKRLVFDLSFPVRVVGCPIVREADGLAMSSRNVYLSPRQRSAAPVLHRALQAGTEILAAPPGAVGAGADRVAAACRRMEAMVAEVPEAVLDYAVVVDARTLEPAVSADGELRLLVAARFGATRLLDNVGFGSG
jgi:pantoate--beta-alanine ligase